MITIQKQEVASWLLAEYLATLHTVREKLRLFEQKHHQTWQTFAQQTKDPKKEDFAQWDDYIEWKAYIKMAEEVITKIDEVKHGNFEVA